MPNIAPHIIPMPYLEVRYGHSTTSPLPSPRPSITKLGPMSFFKFRGFGKGFVFRGFMYINSNDSRKNEQDTPNCVGGILRCNLHGTSLLVKAGQDLFCSQIL